MGLDSIIVRQLASITKNSGKLDETVDQIKSKVLDKGLELLEETGYKTLLKPKKILTLFPDPGRLSKKMICYYSEKLEKVQKPEKGIKIIICDKEKIIQLIKNKKFNSASHIAAFFYYLLKKS